MAENWGTLRKAVPRLLLTLYFLLLRAAVVG